MTQTVYISGYLPKDYSNKIQYGYEVHQKLHEIADAEEFTVKEIKNHYKNVWCRDYLPIKTCSGEYVQFLYNPAYMQSAKYDSMIPQSHRLHAELGINCETSDIILDGGAIEIYNKKGIVSDRVFRDNKDFSEKEIFDRIKELLELDQLTVIPQYPYDFTGHVDGLVRFIDDNNVVVNDPDIEWQYIQSLPKNSYKKKLLENWFYGFKSALINADLNTQYIPTAIPENSPEKSGEGIYINFLNLERMIIMPSYRCDTDKEAARLLRMYYEKPVVKVFAGDLAKEGGMINCVTWTK